MPRIQITRPHSLDEQELRSLGEKLADKLVSRLGGQCQWQGNKLVYQQSGVNAQVDLNPSEVVVDVKLGMLMGAFAGAVESEINRVLDQYL